MEAKFGLRIRASKPSDTGARGHSDPMDVDGVNSLSSGKGKGSSSPRDGCFKCGGAQFQRDCNAHDPRVRAKARVKKTMENPRENPKEPKVRTKLPKLTQGQNIENRSLRS